MPVEIVTPLRQVESRLGVVERLVDADVHAADSVDEGVESAEADLGVVVDTDAGELLDGFRQQLRTAEVVRRVDLVAALTGDRDIEVARDADQRGLTAGGLVREHDGVGA